MHELTLPAPAKINRFLHITSQRDDGYHELQTLFQFIDLADTLSFTLRSDRQIIVDAKIPGLQVKENLITLAAKALQQATNSTHGVEIELTKRIPLGGGLGGGSSDAATTLLALNKLWQLKLSLGQLAQIGLQLGADVPVFVHGHSAWAEGIGEQLTPLEAPESWLLLIVPPVQISTVEIFFDQALSRDTAPCRITTSLVDTGKNDCEPVVRRLYPEVSLALDWLNEFALARMTGTGSCVFAPLADKAAAQKLADRVATELGASYKGFVVRALNVSPLHTKLRELETKTHGSS